MACKCGGSCGNTAPDVVEQPVTVINPITCSVCGDQHTNLVATKLPVPLEINGSVWTHWAMCPKENKPIALKVGV